jgi:ubiquitin carboxyl-terminal hydrolase 8
MSCSDIIPVPGIINLGNTCFMNAVLQCLFNAEQFRLLLIDDIIFEKINTKYLKNKKETISFQINILFKGMHTDRMAVKPVSFARTFFLRSKNMQLYNQEDSHECLTNIIDIIKEETSRKVRMSLKCNSKIVKYKQMYNKYMELKENKASLKDLENIKKDLLLIKQEDREDILSIKSMINFKKNYENSFSDILEIFYGQFISSLECKQCGYNSDKFDSYSIIDLEIPTEKKQQSYTLDQCLDNYIKTEILTNNERWYCPKCKEKVDSEKKIMLWSIPNYLIIHFKRFEINKNSIKKINTLINYPLENLDIQKYIHEKNITTNLSQNKYIYDLDSVIYHSGNYHGGHYFASCKRNNRWYMCNDSNISEEKESDILSNLSYILFYRKKI